MEHLLSYSKNGLEKIAPHRIPLSIGLIVATYAVGLIAVKLLNINNFLQLTPLHLLTSFGLLVWNHEGSQVALWRFLTVAFLVGFWVEVAGVTTGAIFGEYQYGSILGPKFWGTPLMIGVNWAMLTYISNCTLNQFLPVRFSFWAKTAIGALIPVLLDVFIEPVAIEYGMWSWADGTPPLQNYLGWFAVAFALSATFQTWIGNTKNPAAAWLLGAQFLFFLVLGL